VRNGQLTYAAEEANSWKDVSVEEVLDGCAPVHSPVSGSLWELRVEVGSVVVKGETVAIMESMKTEIAIAASTNGVVRQLFCGEGELLQAGQALISIGGENA
jgi:urea carboxylase